MALEYSALNWQAGTLGAAAVASLALAGYGIARAVHHQGTGGTVAAFLGAAALAAPVCYGIYQQYKMGEDKIENTNRDTHFGLYKR